MTKRQRVLYRIGAWTSILTALVHFAGHLAGPQKPANETEARLVELMTTYAYSLPGAPHRTTMDFFDGFSLTFSVCLALLGATALLVLRRDAEAPGLARSLAIAWAGGFGILLGISLRYFFLPPTVCLALAFLAFALSLVPGREAAGRTSG